MTDDFDFIPLYPGHTPRSYSYFKVHCKVLNKYTDQFITFDLYISLKKSLKWLEVQHPRLPSCQYFSYEFCITQVQDEEEILFHHITTREDWERYLQRSFLDVCATSTWKISLKKKFLRFFNNYFKKSNSNFHKYCIE